MTLEQAILEKVRALPPEKQQEILDFAEFLQAKVQQSLVVTEVVPGEPVQAAQPTRSLGERLMAIRQQAIENGMELLTAEEVEQEMAEQRDRHRDLWAE